MSQLVEPKTVAEKPFDLGGKHRARAAFREHLAALKRSPRTVRSYTQQLGSFFTFLDQRDLRAVRPADVEAYQAELLAGPLSVWSVHVKLLAVRRFYDWLERTGQVLVNPALSVRLPKLGERLPRAVLSLTEARRILDAPDTSLPLGIRDKAILELFYSTGLRLAELCALTVHDVDAANGFARINQGKGARDRVVPMGRKAVAYVKEYLRHVRGRLTEKCRDERALFVGQRGRPIHALIVERMIRDYARAAGIEKRVTPHVFRHTCATHLLGGGADLAHVQRLLGHARLDTTQKYLRVAQRDVKQTHRQTHPRA